MPSSTIRSTVKIQVVIKIMNKGHNCYKAMRVISNDQKTCQSQQSMKCEVEHYINSISLFVDELPMCCSNTITLEQAKQSTVYIYDKFQPQWYNHHGQSFKY